MKLKSFFLFVFDKKKLVVFISFRMSSIFMYLFTNDVLRFAERRVYTPTYYARTVLCQRRPRVLSVGNTLHKCTHIQRETPFKVFF